MSFRSPSPKPHLNRTESVLHSQREREREREIVRRRHGGCKKRVLNRKMGCGCPFASGTYSALLRCDCFVCPVQKHKNLKLSRPEALWNGVQKVLFGRCVLGAFSSPHTFGTPLNHGPRSGGTKRDTLNGPNGAKFAVFRRFLLIFAFPWKFQQAENRRKPQIFTETRSSHLVCPS